MPCLLAAGTSILRMSMATRRNAASSHGACAKNSAGAGVCRSETMMAQPWAAWASVGRVVEHLAGLVEADVAQSAQCGERAGAVIIGQHVGRMGQRTVGIARFLDKPAFWNRGAGTCRLSGSGNDRQSRDQEAL